MTTSQRNCFASGARAPTRTVSTRTQGRMTRATRHYYVVVVPRKNTRESSRVLVLVLGPQAPVRVMRGPPRPLITNVNINLKLILTSF